MKIIALIPARYGSSRFPGKPLALLAGKPMIQRVYEQAHKIPGLAGVWVATDDDRIAACVRGFGGLVRMTRPDHPSGTDRLAEAARSLDLDGSDIVVNIQGDQPCFPPEVVGGLIAALQADPGAAIATPVRPLEPARAADPNVVKVVFDHRRRALYFSRAPIPFWRAPADAPRYYKHIGIYAYRVSFLLHFGDLPPGVWEQAEKLEQLRALEQGYPIVVMETTGETCEVDTPADLARAEELLCSAGEGQGG